VTPKKETIRLLRQLEIKCIKCKFYCRSINITCNSRHDVCTIKGEEINPLKETNCNKFKDRTKDIDITIKANDGSKIINTVDLVHLFERDKIHFSLKREGKDLLTGTEDAIINYGVTLKVEY